MTPDEASRIITAVAETVRGFVDTPNAKGALVRRPKPVAPAAPPKWPAETEALYQQFKARLIDECAVDPTLASLLATQAQFR